jgi:murein DD-endopeptidase MepM/ murein hydrolase activator NlpD
VRPNARLLLLAVCAAAIAVAAVPGARGSDLQDKKEQLDARISALRDRIDQSKSREGVLSSEIQSATADIGSLAGRIDVLSDRVDHLQADLDAHRSRLETLRAKLAEQTRRLELLVRQHAIAEEHLEQRLVELYETDQTSTLEILLQASSLDDLLDQLDYFRALGNHDKEIVLTLTRLRDEMRVARAQTAATKKEVAKATAVLARKTAEERAARDQLVAQQNALEAARDQKQSLLTGVRSSRQKDEEDLDSMQAASAAIADQIQAAQAASASSGSSGSGVSSSGFIWPVSGPVVSGFGIRWGRMHEGIDIAVPSGTAVHAAAAGTIIYAGVMSGYGNIVVIDHGNGLATAYAHLSAIWIGSGSVAQGQAIAASGCTGHCLGPHLHFEVRVNGSPVDPLGYL